MSQRTLWISAAAGNIFVGVGSLAIHRFTTAAAGSATRNTARFAVLFLLAGFAAPGLRRWLPSFTEPANLIVAYMAAQFVHFGFVINLHLTLADGFFESFRHLAGSLLGFALVAATGFTSRPVTRPGVRLHTALLYINWLIPMIGYSRHHSWSMRLMLAVVIGALLLRWFPAVKTRTARAVGI